VHKKDFDDYPVIIELRFKNREKAEEFLGGFLDGWGENAPIRLHWNFDQKYIDKLAVDPDEEEED
jgi:hypothetical protein